MFINNRPHSLRYSRQNSAFEAYRLKQNRSHWSGISRAEPRVDPNSAGAASVA